ncbi:MAG: SpoIID/LytB domain-containing protein [Planctomycetota bacterium]
MRLAQQRTRLAPTALAALALLGGCGRSESEPSGAGAAAATSAPLVAMPDAEPIVRVRVLRIRKAESVEIGADGQWLRIADASGDPTSTMIARGPVDVARTGTRWSVGPHSITAPTVDISSIDPDRPTIDVNGAAHPGLLRMVARPKASARAFDVVNHVGVEAYLPGVLARELYGHWHVETFMAQAIAARSFACSEQANFARTRHYDMTNTTRSQAYAGSDTHRRAIEAVARTRGQVLGDAATDAGADGLVPGYYSSCCGGTPARAADAIGDHPLNALPPLDGRGLDPACGDAPVQVWSVVRDTDRLARRLAGSQALTGLRGLRTIEPSTLNTHGRPTHYTVTDATGTAFEIEAESLRRAMDRTVSGLKEPADSLLSSNITVSIAADTVRIAGRGYGHGAGLCQYGAEGRAANGATHAEILAWYYPGSTIVTAYR